MVNNKGIIYFLFLEILLLGIHYLFILSENDAILNLLDKTVVVLSSVGVVYLIYFIALKGQAKITTDMFIRLSLLSIAGILIPPIFLFFLFSQLH